MTGLVAGASADGGVRATSYQFCRLQNGCLGDPMQTITASHLAATSKWENSRAMNELRKILPPELQSWVAARVSRGDYIDAEEFIRDLVRREQRAEEEDAAWEREMIAEGQASGYLDAEPSSIIEEIIAERRARRG